MDRSIFLGALAAFAISGQVMAQDAFSYSYIEADYLDSELDDDGTLGTDVNGDGFGLQGAIAFAPHIHGYIEYTDQDFDFDVGLKTWEVGVGANWNLTPTIDLFGRAGYTSFDFEVFDDKGFAVQAGVRALVGSSFELEGALHYVDLGDFGDNSTIRATGRYWLSQSFGLTAGFDIDSDLVTFILGARFSFN